VTDTLFAAADIQRGLATIGVPYRVVTYLVESERLKPTQVIGRRSCFDREALRKLFVLIHLGILRDRLSGVSAEHLEHLHIGKNGIYVEIYEDDVEDAFGLFMKAVEEGRSK
jgi:hypothetical protein